MKILYVDLQYDYGQKSRGPNVIGQDGFKKSFESLGHEVVGFYYDQYLADTKPLQTDLLAFADEVQPDLIFFCLFQNQFDHQTLQALTAKYTTLNWFGDDQWRFDSFTKYYAKDFSWCVTTDQYALEKYHAIGQKNIMVSQWAAIDAHPTKGCSNDYKYDVSFVGGYHPYRAWFIRQLEKKGINIQVYGNGWPNGPLSSEAMNSLFAQTKINLNLSNSTSLDLGYLTFSIKAFLLALRSKKTNSQIKARNFEIPYFGGFQLSDYVPTLEQYFQVGNEVVCYSNPDEAALQIRYYLENDNLRETIKLAGHKRALHEHGYINRFKDVLEQIK